MTTIKLPNCTVELADIVTAATPEQRDALREALSKPVQPKMEIYIAKKPVKGQIYYISTLYGIEEYEWHEDNSDLRYWNYYIFHRTRASAELELAHTKAKVELTRRCIALGGRVGNKLRNNKTWYAPVINDQNQLFMSYNDYYAGRWFYLPTTEDYGRFIATPNFEQLLRDFYYMQEEGK